MNLRINSSKINQNKSSQSNISHSNSNHKNIKLSNSQNGKILPIDTIKKINEETLKIKQNKQELFIEEHFNNLFKIIAKEKCDIIDLSYLNFKESLLDPFEHLFSSIDKLNNSITEKDYMKRLESLNKRDEFDNKSKELKVNNSIYNENKKSKSENNKESKLKIEKALIIQVNYRKHLLNKRLTELKNRISEKQEIANKNEIEKNEISLISQKEDCIDENIKDKENKHEKNIQGEKYSFDFNDGSVQSLRHFSNSVNNNAKYDLKEENEDKYSFNSDRDSSNNESNEQIEKLNNNVMNDYSQNSIKDEF